VNGQVLKDIKQKVRDKMSYYAVEDPLNSNPAPTTNPETATFECKEEPDQPINPNKLPPIHNNR
jgi:hypothetical protein